jgi:hypothetical protein
VRHCGHVPWHRATGRVASPDSRNCNLRSGTTGGESIVRLWSPKGQSAVDTGGRPLLHGRHNGWALRR